MDDPEHKNTEAFKINDIVEYLPKSVVIKSILRKATGNVIAVSFDSGEILVGRKSPYDTLIQIIEGNSEIIIDDEINLLEAGESIIISAYTSNIIKAKVRFKMISTIIKSGYEDVIL